MEHNSPIKRNKVLKHTISIVLNENNLGYQEAHRR